MKISDLIKPSLLTTTLLCTLCGVASAATENQRIDESFPVSVNAPGFAFPYQNPIYGTIAGVLKIKNVKVPSERVLKLDVPGFAKSVEVHAVLQDASAPLAVVLLGIGGRADSDFSRLWPAWFSEAGYNVLFFDSTFRSAFMDTVPKGPSGNLWSETESARDIIAAFLARSDVQGKVSEVGIAGISYGALQALILGKMSQKGRTPFSIAGIQAWSPPANLEYTAALFDRWFNENRWNYTLPQMQLKVGKHTPVRDDSGGAPLSEDLMRATISAQFHELLPDIVELADSKFHMHLLPEVDTPDASDVRHFNAESWGYVKYAQDMALSYWTRVLGPDVAGTLIGDTQLCNLLEDQPRTSEVILAADDPFNPPSTAEDLHACAPSQRLTILPRGGHMGYVAEPWTRAKLLTLFK